MDIKLSNICKAFNKKPVIRDISLSMSSGEIACLLGPSGSGKTTLIRLLIGAIPTDSGSIHIGPLAVPNREILQKMGFMPQNDALYNDLNGEDNLRFFAQLYGLNKYNIAARIDEMLNLVNLSADRKKAVRHYSGGMKKRLSLAAALIHEPDILLLDEPTVGIDPILRREIWKKLRELSLEGKTILVSTHVLDEVSECGKAGLIYDGRLIAYDAVDALLAKTKDGKLEDLFFMAAEGVI